MKKNYFFLWHYNKLPFVYALMNVRENETNILVVNVQDSIDLKSKILALNGLDRIDEVILVRNTFNEYLINVLYRIFVYPFKKKSNQVAFYLDGFVGYYPLFLANIGLPNEVYFYEEGESIYQDDVLFKKEISLSFKNLVNFFIKKVLFVKKNAIQDIKTFYVRDKTRLLKVFARNSLFKFKFNIESIDEVESLGKISDRDKKLLISVFLSDFSCDFSLMKNEKRAIVLTQPLYFYGIYTKQESIDMFNVYIKMLIEEGYKVYLKLHPKEKEDLYYSKGVQRLCGDFPFELLALLNIFFDKGVTYNSTAINSKLIINKCLIKDELKDGQY
ncbi:alpha-2,8-polysialyltransferase family protein [Aeromonas sp. sif2433]|uniref:alpha-2,8-polysialyltransferase family protein n=1 Tax=Aeromonas sp. sif2433 TaxID=2854794 RepID=UPI001C476CBA|nr:alpha-2,8-polysialyltransferase family protein [Aeromonas sp. sif2433]MBV7413741.1 alpha-2,8-polysialyltransferase family protein [Aeromonas sp. sif2433]